MAAAAMQIAQTPAATCSRASVGKVAFIGARMPAAPMQRLEARRGEHLVAHAVAELQSLGADKWNDSYYPTGADAANVHKTWYIIDAEGQTLGRLANLAAFYIRGKNSPAYTPSMDMGAYVIVINADKVAVTGRKETQKLYHRHTVGRPGGWKVETLREVRARVPERIVEKAVKGMLPRGRLGDALFTHLKVFKGAAHPHGAQQPQDITARISKKPAEAAAL